MRQSHVENQGELDYALGMATLWALCILFAPVEDQAG